MTPFLSVFHENNTTRPPFWFMRQAGRFLPEYRKIRQQKTNFLELCYTPESATEITLQPLRRFDMDAAILFSDILVIPDALGVDVRFEKGEGPRLKNTDALEEPGVQYLERLSPVYETLKRIRSELPEDKTLIGFAGAPWTLACYLLEGRGGNGFPKALEAIYTQTDHLHALIETMVEAVSRHLIAQIRAGADVVQLFDSWAGLVPAAHVDALLMEPVRAIVGRVKDAHPEVPVIGFPRGLSGRWGEYVTRTGVDALGVDTATSLICVRKEVGPDCVLQGNLDPVLLAASREETLKQGRMILESMRGQKFIFNLGHGVLPHTPVEHVQAVSELIKNYE